MYNETLNHFICSLRFEEPYFHFNLCSTGIYIITQYKINVKNVSKKCYETTIGLMFIDLKFIILQAFIFIVHDFVRKIYETLGALSKHDFNFCVLHFTKIKRFFRWLHLFNWRVISLIQRYLAKWNMYSNHLCWGYYR